MEIEKELLTVEQMKHLQELGINTSDASVYWMREVIDWRGKPSEGRQAKFYPSLVKERIVSGFQTYEVVPAYTLGKIIDHLPKKMSFNDTECLFNIMYGHDGNAIAGYFLHDYPFYQSTGDSLKDAAYDLLKSLIEDKLIEINHG